MCSLGKKNRFFNFIFTSTSHEAEIDKSKLTDETLKYILEFIKEIRGLNNIFDLITDEYVHIMSEENLKYLTSQPKPLFKLELPYTIKNFYNECSEFYNKQFFTLILYYNKAEDIFNVYIKLYYDHKTNPWISNIFTYIISVSFDFEKKVKDDSNSGKYGRISLKQFNDSKSQVLIYSQTSFSKILNKAHAEMKKPNFALSIYIKPCHLHAVMTQSIINNFSLYYDDKKLYKLFRESFEFIIRSNPSCENYDHVVLSIFNWGNLNVFIM